MIKSILPTSREYRATLLFFVTCFVLLALDAAGQGLNDQLKDYNRQRIELNKNGMLVLSGWAITNMVVGGVGFFKSEGRSKYFHQMNTAWNVVNLTIAGFALHQYLQADPSVFTLTQSMDEARSIENLLLLNMGLDVGYIAAGAFLWERGIRKNHDRLLGYGPSLILQGGFLLVFDGVLYALNRSQNEQLFKLLDNVSLSANTISLSIPL